MLEFRLEIKPTKLIKGQDLARLMTETNLDVVVINSIFELSDLPGEESVFKVEYFFKQRQWYAEFVYILQNLKVQPGIHNK